MYSRKFGQNSLPPDYSGISFRHNLADAPSNPEAPTDSGPACAPRYPTEVSEKVFPKRNIKLKRAVKPDTNSEKSTTKKKSGLGALSEHSFTMEDIVLAGLILLLLNSDCDSELLLILGFLLLVGLQS